MKGEGGGTLISTYIIGSARVIFGVQHFESHYFWGFSEKYFFGGKKILWIFLGGHHKIGLFSGHFYVFYGIFFRSSYNMWDIFGLLKFQIF